MSFQSKLSKFTKANKSKKLRLGVYQKTDWRSIINDANRSVEDSLQKLDIDPSIGPFNSDIYRDWETSVCIVTGKQVSVS